MEQRAISLQVREDPRLVGVTFLRVGPPGVEEGTFVESVVEVEALRRLGVECLVARVVDDAVDAVVIVVSALDVGIVVAVTAGRKSTSAEGRVGVEAADSDSRLELRRTRRMPTRAFRVGVASYSSSQDGCCTGVANGVVKGVPKGVEG